MDTTRVCETCGSENVRTAGDGGMGFCEDCDAPCTCVEVSEGEELDLCDMVREHDEAEDSKIDYPDDQFMYDNL